MVADQVKVEAAISPFNAEYDRLSELKAFDETKVGVKGLVDAGITEVPLIFHHKLREHESVSKDDHIEFSIPVIDLGGLTDEDPARRSEIVEKVREASEKWGFFQIVNHGISESVLEEIIDGMRRFHEQESEVKKAFYSRDSKKSVRYNSNFDLYTGSFTNWRDTFFCFVAPDLPSPQDLPSVCSDIVIEYAKQVMRVGVELVELLSEALGLSRDCLKEIGCAEGLALLGHYYPACPQPEVTMGTTQHADNDFFTVLLQDQIGGLQVLHNDKWVNVPPQPGALVVNIGDLLQLISNEKFKSVEHRVLASDVGPRISVPSFFSTYGPNTNKVYGPIKELLSENNPPKFRETTIEDFYANFLAKGLDGGSKLDYLRL